LAASPHIVVMGAGSIGCFVGGAWQAAGCKVSFLGRERIGDEIATNGLGLSDHSGWRIHLAHDLIHFATKPALLSKADIIVLTVKSIGTAAAAKEIARHARKGTLVLSFQNGVSNVGTLRKMLPGFDVVQGVVPFYVAHLGRGRWHKGTAGDLAAEDNDRMRALAARIGAGPARLTLLPDITGLAWGKLLINLNNAVNALSGQTLLEQLGNRMYRRVVAASIIEALGIFKAAGIEPAQIGPVPPKLLPHAMAAPDFIYKALLRMQKIDSSARSSMADDFAAGRPTEIDYLNGEVVRLAKSLGRDAPVNSAILHLVKQREAGVEHIWTAGDLCNHILKDHPTVPLFRY
jgi:2-dehydropantoate 2-reductase